MQAAPSFHGRQTQLEALDAVLGRASAGQPQVALITGDAGIGKSRLIQHWVGRQRSVRVLLSRADPEEKALDFATVVQLLADQDVPSKEADGLHNVLMAGGALLQAFSECQADSHTGVVVVDDIQWADDASLSALAFAARRLRRDRLLVVTAARVAPVEATGLTRLARDPTGTEIHLQGLTLEETGELVLGLKGVRLDPLQLQHLHDVTNGNPLWIRSAVHDIAAEDLRATASLVPVAPSLALSVRRQLNRCPLNAVSFVQALAILDGPQPVSRVASLAGVADVWAAVDAAIDSALVVSVGSPPDLSVAFAHPAIASTIVESLTFGQRVSLHRAAVRSSTSTAEALRHEVACAPGPDAELAGRVLAYGRERAAEGQVLDASRWIGDAAALTPNPPERGPLLLETAHAALAGGFQYSATRTLADPQTPQGGYRDFLLASIAWLRGDAAEAAVLARSASESEDRHAQAGAAIVFSQLALIGAQPDEAGRWTQRALELSGDMERPLARAGAAASLIIQRNPAGVLDLLGPAPPETGPWQVAEEGIRGLALIHLDRPDEARSVLLTSIAAARRHNQFSLASVPLANLGMLELRVGRWPEATLALEQALAFAEAFEEYWSLGVILSLSIGVPARQGDFDTARDKEAAATTAVRRKLGGAASWIYLRTARVQLAHARSDSAVLLREGRALAARPSDSTADLPGVSQWRGLVVDTLVALDEIDEAADHVARLDQLAATAQNLSAGAEAAFARAVLLARTDGVEAADESFTQAVKGYRDAKMPFEAALARLRWGSAWRRTGDVAVAEPLLTLALTTFERLGARSYAELARQELRAGGVSPQHSGGMAGLTGQESVVATLVAKGLSNREIAAEMVLSPRTVEYHLASVFRKVGVTSRSQLTGTVLRSQE